MIPILSEGQKMEPLLRWSRGVLGRLCAVVVLGCVALTLCLAQKKPPLIPPYAQNPNPQYPIFHKRLTHQEVSSLHLKSKQLHDAWTGFNFSPKLGRFLWDTLPPGTTVLADEHGVPIY